MKEKINSAFEYILIISITVALVMNMNKKPIKKGPEKSETKIEQLRDSIKHNTDTILQRTR